MSPEHKRALALGREQGRAVRKYLEALETHKPKRGRKRSEEGMRLRLKQIEEQLPSSDPLSRLRLIQERIDLQAALDAMDSAANLKRLEDQFVAAAAEYSRRKGISYAAWRALGIDAAVLRRAGIDRTRS